MNPLFWKLLRFLPALCIASATFPAAGQTASPSLGIQINAGQPILNLTGATGTVYAIQYSSNLFPASTWVDRTLLQPTETGTAWIDPSAPSPGARFYRAVSVPTPDNPNLVFIQPGTFTMGSPSNEVDRSSTEGPQMTVTISRGFWISKYLVTQSDYLSVTGTNTSYYNGDRSGPPWNDIDYGTDLTRPIEQVSWNDAVNYCALLTTQERDAGRIPLNWIYRLPTEAEWEYACRAGTTTRFYYGDDPGYANLTNYAWYFDNSDGQTHPVGELLPNAWGLYDMAGNVWEWCQDWYGPYPGGSLTDPKGPATGTYRVWRGGGWFYLGRYCRSARRFNHLPTYIYEGLGFRVVLAPAQQ
jgi:formylglycine-generating enzyme required for sulfatase activity